MIITRFGDTHAAAYTFGTLKASDQFQTVRASATSPAPMTSGAYDYYKTLRPPLGAFEVVKTFDLIASSRTYATLDTARDALLAATINANESKLWCAVRDGSYRRRWAWAKCTALDAPGISAARITHPVTITFLCREGIWYAESVSTSTQTPSVTAFTLSNAGTLPAPVKVTFSASSGGTTTGVDVTNGTNGSGFAWAGSLASGSSLVVDSQAYSAKIGSTGEYNGITPDAPGAFWLWLLPGSNSVTFTASYTGGLSAAFEWSPQWAM